jgi:hypothetical protein
MAKRTQRVARIATVILVAAAAGHFMQQDETAGMVRVAAATPEAAPVAHRAVPVAPPAEPATQLVAAAADAGLHGEFLGEIVPVPPAGTAIAPIFDAPVASATPAAPAASVPPPPIRSPAATAQAAGSAAATAPGRSGRLAAAPIAAAPAGVAAPAAAGCEETLTVTAAPGAMLAVGIAAPCQAGGRIVLRHAGLAVGLRLDAAGRLDTRLPALDPAGAVAVQFPAGRRIEAAALLADLAGLARIALQWSGIDAFALHALAPGAGHGEPGHVSAARPGAAAGAPGSLVALGDAGAASPLLAEIYTFAGPPGSVRIEIEAALTPATCGRDALAEVIEWADGRLLRRDLVIPMPACDEGAGYLVLQKPLRDLTFAAN